MSAVEVSMKCVVDTCVINRLADGTLPLEKLPPDAQFIVSHVQRDEINKTKDATRRAKLLEVFSTVVDVVAPTESFLVGVSRVGAAKVSDGRDYSNLKATLDSLNKGKANNTHDVLIAEVALKNGYTLITSDKSLSVAAEKHGCQVIYVET
jgi:predicted nucleic acid-binding protein